MRMTTSKKIRTENSRYSCPRNRQETQSKISMLRMKTPKRGNFSSNKLNRLKLTLPWPGSHQPNRLNYSQVPSEERELDLQSCKLSSTSYLRSIKRKLRKMLNLYVPMRNQWNPIRNQSRILKMQRARKLKRRIVLKVLKPRPHSTRRKWTP